MEDAVEDVKAEVVDGAERGLPEERALRVAGGEARDEEERGDGGGVGGGGAKDGEFGELGEESGEGVDGDGAAEPAAEDGLVLGEEVGFEELEGGVGFGAVLAGVVVAVGGVMVVTVGGLEMEE